MFEAMEAGWGLDVVLWLQTFRHPVLDTLASILATLGGDYGYILLLPVIFWAIDRRLGQWLLVVLVTVIFVITFGKETLERPRPFVFAPEQVAQVVEGEGFGFPSGHVGISLAVWGFIALWVRRWWGYLLLMVYIALMAWARMYSGVHYPQDVIGGLVLGSLVGGGFYALRTQLSSLWMRVPLSMQIVLVLGAGLLMAYLVRGDEAGVSGAGILIGGGLALLGEMHGGSFRVDGSLIKRGLRVVVGLLLTLLVFFTLDYSFEPLEPDIVFRLLRYGLVAVVILGLYPLILMNTGFTQPDDTQDT